MKFAVKHLAEDFLSQDVLYQHLAHIGIGQARVDGLLRMHQELGRCGAELLIVVVLPGDHVAQCLQHRWQVGLELRHCRAEVGDFLPLERNEQRKQLAEPGRVRHVAAQDDFLMLDQDGRYVITEDDVVLRVTLFELLVDLFFKIVALVLCLPVAQWHAQLMQ